MLPKDKIRAFRRYPVVWLALYIWLKLWKEYWCEMLLKVCSNWFTFICLRSSMPIKAPFVFVLCVWKEVLHLCWSLGLLLKGLQMVLIYGNGSLIRLYTMFSRMWGKTEMPYFLCINNKHALCRNEWDRPNGGCLRQWVHTGAVTLEAD